jgi:tetratricopeptide (TPR) repeat protein
MVNCGMSRIQATQALLLVSILFVSTHCASFSGREKPIFAYTPEAFRREILLRVPDLTERLARAPFEIDRATIERARKQVMAAPQGPARVEALVAFLSDPKPDGLGLVYSWNASGSAAATIELGRGNCVALASVLVGLGRGLRWPIFYAQAGTKWPETRQFEQVQALSDHMVVIITAKTLKMVVDFTGLIEQTNTIKLIDDLTAYAQLINNIAGQRVMNPDKQTGEADWQAAHTGFLLATHIQPNLGRAWNNLGITLHHLGRIDEARVAYERAVELDTAFGSAERNLSMMETRAHGETKLLESALPH